MVKFKEVVASSAFEVQVKLTICLGKDIIGNPGRPSSTDAAPVDRRGHRHRQTDTSGMI
jgi:hypothetical protein